MCRYRASLQSDIPYWSENIFYVPGTLVRFEGTTYQCDAPHTSGSLAREPTRSPHLWTPLTSPSISPSPGPERIRLQTLTEEQSLARLPQYLKDELAGARIWKTSSVGVMAYSEDGAAERMRQKVFKDWTVTGDWLRSARARTAAYERDKPMVRWELIEGSARFPADAIVVGDDGRELFAARTYFDGGVHLGKCWEGGSEFAYLGGVRTSEWFEVLCGFEGVEWIPFNGPASMPGWQPVEGGRAKSKQWAVLVARGMVDGQWIPGGCLAEDDCASLPCEGREVSVHEFEILVHSNLDRR